MNEVAAAEAVAQLPLAGVLVLIVIGFLKGWVITPGRFAEMKERVDEMRRDRDFWRGVALRAVGVVEKAAERDSGASARDGV